MSFQMKAAEIGVIPIKAQSSSNQIENGPSLSEKCEIQETNSKIVSIEKLDEDTENTKNHPANSTDNNTKQLSVLTKYNSSTFSGIKNYLTQRHNIDNNKSKDETDHLKPETDLSFNSFSQNVETNSQTSSLTSSAMGSLNSKCKNDNSISIDNDCHNLNDNISEHIDTEVVANESLDSQIDELENDSSDVPINEHEKSKDVKSDERIIERHETPINNSTDDNEIIEKTFPNINCDNSDVANENKNNEEILTTDNDKTNDKNIINNLSKDECIQQSNTDSDNKANSNDKDLFNTAILTDSLNHENKQTAVCVKESFHRNEISENIQILSGNSACDSNTSTVENQKNSLDDSAASSSPNKACSGTNNKDINMESTGSNDNNNNNDHKSNEHVSVINNENDKVGDSVNVKIHHKIHDGHQNDQSKSNTDNKDDCSNTCNNDIRTFNEPIKSKDNTDCSDIRHNSDNNDIQLKNNDICNFGDSKKNDRLSGANNETSSKLSEIKTDMTDCVASECKNGASAEKSERFSEIKDQTDLAVIGTKETNLFTSQSDQNPQNANESENSFRSRIRDILMRSESLENLSEKQEPTKENLLKNTNAIPSIKCFEEEKIKSVENDLHKMAMVVYSKSNAVLPMELCATKLSHQSQSIDCKSENTDSNSSNKSLVLESKQSGLAIQDLSFLKMKTPDFSKALSSKVDLSSLNFAKKYEKAAEKRLASQTVVNSSNFAEIRNKYNYVSDLQLKNPLPDNVRQNKLADNSILSSKDLYSLEEPIPHIILKNEYQTAESRSSTQSQSGSIHHEYPQISQDVTMSVVSSLAQDATKSKEVGLVKDSGSSSELTKSIQNQNYYHQNISENRNTQKVMVQKAVHSEKSLQGLEMASFNRNSNKPVDNYLSDAKMKSYYATRYNNESEMRQQMIQKSVHSTHLKQSQSPSSSTVISMPPDARPPSNSTPQTSYRYMDPSAVSQMYPSQNIPISGRLSRDSQIASPLGTRSDSPSLQSLQARNAKPFYLQSPQNVSSPLPQNNFLPANSYENVSKNSSNPLSHYPLVNSHSTGFYPQPETATNRTSTQNKQYSQQGFQQHNRGYYQTDSDKNKSNLISKVDKTMLNRPDINQQKLAKAEMSNTHNYPANDSFYNSNSPGVIPQQRPVSDANVSKFGERGHYTKLNTIMDPYVYRRSSEAALNFEIITKTLNKTKQKSSSKNIGHDSNPTKTDDPKSIKLKHCASTETMVEYQNVYSREDEYKTIVRTSQQSVQYVSTHESIRISENTTTTKEWYDSVQSIPPSRTFQGPTNLPDARRYQQQAQIQSQLPHIAQHAFNTRELPRDNIQSGPSFPPSNVNHQKNTLIRQPPPPLPQADHKKMDSTETAKQIPLHRNYPNQLQPQAYQQQQLPLSLKKPEGVKTDLKASANQLPGRVQNVISSSKSPANANVQEKKPLSQSPLDLSVKTVKTKADSTVVHDYSMNPRRMDKMMPHPLKDSPSPILGHMDARSSSNAIQRHEQTKMSPANHTAPNHSYRPLPVQDAGIKNSNYLPPNQYNYYYPNEQHPHIQKANNTSYENAVKDRIGSSQKTIPLPFPSTNMRAPNFDNNTEKFTQNVQKMDRSKIYEQQQSQQPQTSLQPQHQLQPQTSMQQQHQLQQRSSQAVQPLQPMQPIQPLPPPKSSQPMIFGQKPEDLKNFPSAYAEHQSNHLHDINRSKSIIKHPDPAKMHHPIETSDPNNYYKSRTHSNQSKVPENIINTSLPERRKDNVSNQPYENAMQQYPNVRGMESPSSYGSHNYPMNTNQYLHNRQSPYNRHSLPPPDHLKFNAAPQTHFTPPLEDMRRKRPPEILMDRYPPPKQMRSDAIPDSKYFINTHPSLKAEYNQAYQVASKESVIMPNDQRIQYAQSKVPEPYQELPQTLPPKTNTAESNYMMQHPGQYQQNSSYMPPGQMNSYSPHTMPPPHSVPYNHQKDNIEPYRYKPADIYHPNNQHYNHTFAGEHNWNKPMQNFNHVNESNNKKDLPPANTVSDVRHVSPSEKIPTNNVSASVLNCTAESDVNKFNSMSKGADHNVILKLRSNLELREMEKQKLLQNQNSSERSDESNKSDIASIIAARIRTKGELKGFTPMPSSSDSNFPGKIKPKEEPDTDRDNDTEHQKIEEAKNEKKLNEPSVEDSKTTSSDNLLDWTWASTCNDFLEQLQNPNIKKRGRVKRQKDQPETLSSNNTQDEKDSFPQIDQGNKIDNVCEKNIKHEITSSDEDKPLLLLRQQSLNESNRNAIENHEEKSRTASDSDVSSCMKINRNIVLEKLSEKIAKNNKEKIREKREREKRESLESTSESETEQTKDTKPMKKIIRKPRTRASVGAVNKFKDDGEDDHDDECEDSDTLSYNKLETCKDKIPLKKRKRKDNTSSESEIELPRNAKNKKLSYASDSPAKLSESFSLKSKSNGKSRNEEANDSDGDDLEASINANIVKKRPVAAKVEETMTRSKRKKELEEQLANSKVLRNDKIIKCDKSFRLKSPSERSNKCSENSDKAENKSSNKNKCRKTESDSTKGSALKKKLEHTSSSDSDSSDNELSKRLRSRTLTPHKSSDSIKDDKAMREKLKSTTTPIKEKSWDRKGSKGTPRKSDTDQNDDNKSLFQPGWEQQLYHFKRSLKIPDSLITIGRPPYHHKALSLPDLDSQNSSDACESLSETIKTKHHKALPAKLPPKKGRPPGAATNNDKKATEPEEPVKNDSKSKSIIDLLHQRVYRPTVKNKKTKILHGSSEPKILPQSNEVELLPTPGREGDNAFKAENVFETTVLKSRTRKEHRTVKNQEIIREVFGADYRPASAPPCNFDKAKKEAQNQEKPNLTFDQTYEQYLQKMNLDFDKKIRKQKTNKDSDSKQYQSNADNLLNQDDETLDNEFHENIDANKNSTIASMERGDTPSIHSEIDATPASFKNAFKTKKARANRSGRRKGSSGN